MKVRGIIAAMVMIVMCLILMAGCQTGECPEAVSSATIIGHEVINASAENIWKYLLVDARKEKDGVATLDWWPDWRAKNFHGNFGVGRTFDIEEDYFGRKYQGTAVATEYTANQKYVLSYSGSITKRFAIILEPYQKGNKMILMLEGVEAASDDEINDLTRRVDSALALIKQNAEKMPPAESPGAAREVSTASETTMVSVVINAPVEKVFAYMTDPVHRAEWMWTDQSNFQGSGLGQTYEWEAEGEGQVFRGQAVTSEYVPNQKLVDLWRGDAHGIDTWLFVPEGVGTKVTYIELGFVQGPPTTKAAWDNLMKDHEESIQKSLQKAKAILEK